VVNDIPFAVCETKLCNTKELFDKTLFCLVKGKNEDKHNKAIKQCDQECFVYRHGDGKCMGNI